MTGVKGASSGRLVRRGVVVLLAVAWAVLMVARLGSSPPGGAVVVEQAWARPGLAGGNSAVYLTLRNAGSSPLVLVGASSDVARQVEIHESFRLSQTGGSMHDAHESQPAHDAHGTPSGHADPAAHGGAGGHGDAMGMRPVSSITVPPGQAVRFQPGGFHIMLMGLERALAVGDQFTVRLRFEGHDPLEVSVPVQLDGPPQGVRSPDGH